MEGVLVLDDVGVLELLQDCDLMADLLLRNELAVHLLDRHLPPRLHVPPTVHLPKRTLPNAVFLRKDVVAHLDLHLLVHLINIIKAGPLLTQGRA